jgi:lysophospholipase L1-like esterase
MRRLLLILLLAGSILVVAGFVWKSNGVPAAYKPLGPGDTYLALGDSLAAGFTVSAPGEAYVARIAQALRQTKPTLKVNNMAVAGETSVSFRALQLPRALAFIAAERKAGRRVSPITIDIGGNDARNVERSGRPARVEAMQRVGDNLGRSLDELLRATRDPLGGRTADIVVMNYYNPYGGDPADASSPAYWTAQLNLAIARAAAARGVPVANVASAFDGGLAYRYTYITTGDIHANADGHRVIAAQFWKALGYPGGLAAR